MLKRSAHTRSLLARSAFAGLEQLEPRRVLDGSCGNPACDELIEITRLDGGESFWVRADDPTYGSGECDLAPEPDTSADAELYAFTTRSNDGSPTTAIHDDQPGSDADLYAFGQDRGPQIDDEAEYETSEEAPAELGLAAQPATDMSGAPTQDQIEPAQPEQPDAPMPAEATEEIVPIALVPIAGSIRWIGEGSVAVGELRAGVGIAEPDAPATWRDLAALPVTEIVVQA